MSNQICPKCNRSRQTQEKIVEKDGKSWLIEYCEHCQYNFEITEYLTPPKPPTKKQQRWFHSRLKPDRDEE